MCSNKFVTMFSCGSEEALIDSNKEEANEAKKSTGDRNGANWDDNLTQQKDTTWSKGIISLGFLRVQGLKPSIIGGFSGLSAFMGVAATFVSAKMIKRFGVLKILPVHAYRVVLISMKNWVSQPEREISSQATIPLYARSRGEVTHRSLPPLASPRLPFPSISATSPSLSLPIPIPIPIPILPSAAAAATKSRIAASA
ncbi:unnamed protein product [Fraxinus pennsylvanica]|uniref:Solute carrier family 40 member n=1 Tax=Fraxinus pennsylvanica TaxID=56036 RepID=A0AAD2DWD9_9LAMI|nr:unnamed protein product [Fraxinus pennsylvanica]